MTPDQINSGFELAAGLLLMLNVKRLYRDKNFRGVCIAPTALMAAWGCWNLYFYPHLNAWWSFAAGIPIVIVNAIWVGQMIYYRDGGAYWFNLALKNYFSKVRVYPTEELAEKLYKETGKRHETYEEAMKQHGKLIPGRTDTCQEGTHSARPCQASQEADRCDVGMHGCESCKRCDSEQGTPRTTSTPGG